MPAKHVRLHWLSLGLLASINPLFSSDAAFAQDLPPFKLGLMTQIVSSGFELKPKPNGSSLKYRPAQSNYAGIILGYRWLSGTASFAVPAASEVRDIEGTSRYQDYRLSYYARRFGVEANYGRYAGYLIENSTELSTSALGGQVYYKIPDLETIGYGVTLIYVLNPEKYSLPAAMDQTAIQSASAGSWLLMATWRTQSISSSSPLIPAEKMSAFGADQRIDQVSMVSLGAGGGYSQNWIFGNFFVSPLLALTLGYQQVNDELAEDSTKGFGKTNDRYSSAGVNAHLRLAVGANSRDLFVAGNLLLDSFGRETQFIRITQSITALTLSAGIRF